VRVVVDMSSMERMHRDADKALSTDNIHNTIVAPVIAAARRERETHRYQNRTGRLEASTQAVSIRRSADINEVWLQAGPFMVSAYAGYVNARGFMSIDALAFIAEAEIRMRLSRLVR